MNRRADSWLLLVQALAAAGLGLAWLLTPARGAGWPGLVCLGLGLGLGVWALVSLGSSFGVAPTPRPGATLVRSGIYRWSRHPMYVAVCLVVIGAGISRPGRSVLLIMSLNLVFYLLKARYEEARLRARYHDYEEYRSRTPAAFLRRLRPSRARKRRCEGTNAEHPASGGDE